MRILFLAPQPFFVERGTPIAVRMALEVLLKKGHTVDLLTYGEGASFVRPGLRHLRIAAPRFLANIPPGISLKKLFADLLFTAKAVRLAIGARQKRYDLVHAVEEAVFIALFLKLVFGVRYVYDMDSRVSRQVVEKWPACALFLRAFSWLETAALRQSHAVIAVCQALAEVAKASGARSVHVVNDVSLLNLEDAAGALDLRQSLRLSASAELVMYIGNLEGYQGIDLLIASFARVASRHLDGHLVIIGGSAQQIAHYREKVTTLGLNGRIHLVGPRPVSQLRALLTQATVVASPRIKGENTPMKIYSYLDCGRPLLATDLPTHTQVMDSAAAMLAAPNVSEYSEGLSTLLSDRVLQQKLAQNAAALVATRYTPEVFERDFVHAYEALEIELGGTR